MCGADHCAVARMAIAQTTRRNHVRLPDDAPLTFQLAHPAITDLDS